MEKEERLTKQIKTVYTEIAKRLVDPSFSFPEGGQAKRQLSQFIVNFTQICGGEFNTSRLVDYCVFQLHKNRNAPVSYTHLDVYKRQVYIVMVNPRYEICRYKNSVSRIA